MVIINITSRAIPWLSDEIKISINRGDWLLFESECMEDASYFLDIGRKILRINHKGILGEYNKSEFNPDIDKIIYFSDVEKPESLSNASMVNFA